MEIEEFINRTLTDIKVKISEEFDRNFERKAFFDEKWPQPKFINRRGSMMMRTGKLRRSITSELSGTKITFSSSMPYAELHNDGGSFKVTAKMKKYFWAKYYETSGIKTKKTTKISIEAKQWKALALKKIGETIKIERRQFIGHHPQTDKMILEIINKNISQLQIKPFK